MMLFSNCSDATLLTALTLSAVLTAGCGVQPETLERLQEAVNTVSDTRSALGPGEHADSELPAEFEPPYPDRVDPFAFPLNSPVDDFVDTAVRSAARVQVLGFAELDQPRVFLRCNDQTASLQVGETIDGVKIVAIKPPVVELQWGAMVWTASMFDTVKSTQ